MSADIPQAHLSRGALLFYTMRYASAGIIYDENLDKRPFRNRERFVISERKANHVACL